MAKAIKRKAISLKDYVLVNVDKFERVVYGSMAAQGRLANGIGENASDEDKLAAYDRLGGLILKDGRKLKTGCFWNFEKRFEHFSSSNVIKSPVVVFLLKDLGGKEVEVAEGKEIPLEIKAAEQVEKIKKSKKK